MVCLFREYTNHLLQLAEDGVISWEDIARECLCYMSEDDVSDMCQSTLEVYLNDEDEDDND